MSVLLPDVGYTDLSIIPLDFGGTLSGSLGGADQRLNRLGNRFAVRITTPPLLSKTDGRVFFQRLLSARVSGVMFRFPQAGQPVGAPGAPLVNGAVAGGSTLPIKGLTPRYPIREGQPLSIIHSSRRYLYIAGAEAIADGSGNASLALNQFAMLRTALANGDVIELGVPMIEGMLEGDPASWDRAAANSAPFVFTIREMA
jgi:hypothetical protein